VVAAAVVMMAATLVMAVMSAGIGDGKQDGRGILVEGSGRRQHHQTIQERGLVCMWCLIFYFKVLNIIHLSA
jgi:hypothetical protein